MSRKSLFVTAAATLLFGLALVFSTPAQASPVAQSPDDPVAWGQYLTTIAGCRDCHTPLSETGLPDASRAFQGGRPFELGPLGVVLTSNLTPDEETGLGAWSDDEIITAITTGLAPDGHKSFPVMPYAVYAGMARSDLEAIVAYLRSLEPASNPLPRDQIVPVEELPVIEYRGPATPPDNSNPNARGSYLVNAVMACTDCHTPLDQTTGAPNFDMFLAGGQPYEGPWGIVYSANITPHEVTGIGSWTNEEVERVFRSGVRIDGRVLVLMPWVEYSVITDEDLDALITYIRQDIAPVDNEVPAPALEAAFIQYVELPVEEADDPAAGAGSNTNLLIGLGVVLVLGLGVGLYMGFRGGKSAEG